MIDPEVAALRPLLFSIAYRMLGQVSEAEDVVQEAFLRYQGAVAGGVEVRSPRAYLAATVTRLSIDQLRKALVQRRTYAGQWLPDPLLTEEDGGGPAARAEVAESVSMAFLLVLERLNPVERAVFLLHDVFGYEHREVAVIVHKSEAACRQIALRARRRVEAARPRLDAATPRRSEIAERFFAALSRGDLEGLAAVLAEDVVVYGDGGGKAPQWGAPICGVDRVARLFAGLGGRFPDFGVRVRPHTVNGQPGALLVDRDGRLICVFALEVSDGAVRAVRSVINPDKLGHLGPVADVRALLHLPRQAGG